MQKSRASVETDTQRIEVFSDGVFAIAITLLIVEIRVPQVQATAGATNTHSLTSALFALWPSYFAYILSFVMIGISGQIITTSFSFMNEATESSNYSTSCS